MKFEVVYASRLGLFPSKSTQIVDFVEANTFLVCPYCEGVSPFFEWVVWIKQDSCESRALNVFKVYGYHIALVENKYISDPHLFFFQPLKLQRLILDFLPKIYDPKHPLLLLAKQKQKLTLFYHSKVYITALIFRNYLS